MVRAVQGTEERQDGYLIPDIGDAVLHNRWGVTEPAVLAALEREATVFAAMELADRPVERTFDRLHLAELHRRLFGDVYEWAGTMRDEIRVLSDGTSIGPVERLEKGGTAFAPSGEIHERLAGLLPAVESALGCESEETFAGAAAAVLGELNAIHPFREGNGRVQRYFVEEMAREAGFEVDFGVVDPPRNISASEAAIHGDLQPLAALMRDAVVAERRELLLRAEELLADARQWVSEAGLSRRTLDEGEEVGGMLVEMHGGIAIGVTEENDLVVVPEDALEPGAGVGDAVRMRWDATCGAEAREPEFG